MNLSSIPVSRRRAVSCALVAVLSCLPAKAAVLFEDDFNEAFVGWSVVYPDAAYFEGPLKWEYDLVNSAIVERSNIYTDSASYSSSTVTPMLINDTVTGSNFVYTARLTAGDDDGFGLIFGFQDEDNFYRLTFARQLRSGGYPWHGWVVDRKSGGVVTNLFGYGTPGYTQTFVNTAGRPFDVTISLTESNALSLTVVDNPLVAPVSYPLVVNQPLPSAAAGRVGVFTWGMAGGTPPGFRIQNLDLSPLPLSGSLYGSTEWSPVFPPRTAGNSTDQVGQPFWSLTAGQFGPSGVLEETGDCYQGNDVPGQVDFTGPTLIAGSETWSNYVVAARITPFDDDAEGILLRYANPSNFYRIVLRSQASSTGPPQGLSVQKNVDGLYSEVYRDNPVSYSPVSGIPYELVAQIQADTLDILLVADPDGASQVYTYGPFAVTGVETGKVGLLSWAMSRVEFDWITVQDGTALYVSSPFGSPTPDRGLSTYEAGTVVNASVGPSVDPAGTRRTATGWTGTGSVPASGTGTNVSFSIDAFSQLNWSWQTEYALFATNTPGGTVIQPPGGWFLQGTNVTITAQADTGYLFTGWSGDSQSTSPTLNLVMAQAYSLTANFAADSDGDGLPDDWEYAWFGDLTAEPDGINGDPDHDGRSNRQELADGTNPLVADILRIEHLQLKGDSGILSVSNNSGTRYSVERSGSLPANWATLATLQTTTTYTSSLPAGNRAFWRLEQPARPPEVPPFVPGSWTLVVLPDTQIYSGSYPELFKDQTRWIAANKDRFNIKYVLHLGDIVDANSSLQQWTNARAAMNILDGEVPYAMAPGNHDYGSSGIATDRSTHFDTFFPLTKFESWPTFGGAMEPGKMDDTYHLFSAGGVDWLLLALEWGPRDSAVAWANQVSSNYPARRKILITHAYLYSDDTRYDWATKGSAQSWNPHSYGTAGDPDGTNDGEELWQKLVRGQSNFVMVFNGHVLNDGLGRLSSTNDHGQVVHQVLANYQMKAQGGGAFLRLVEFHPDGKTVQIKTYSPHDGTYKTDSQNQFQLTLSPPL